MISGLRGWRPEGMMAALFVISVFLSALRKVGDTDAWLHLSFGKLIWQLKGMPQTELFTYPVSDMSLPYTSWLFGVIYYLIITYIGEYGLVLLKACIITTAFYILLRDSLRPYNNYTIAVIIMTAALILSSYRFVLRPDIFFMLFLSFSIFSLNAYLYDNKKYIYALPVTHMLWANMHSSITVMFAPFLAFIVGGLIQQRLSRKGIHFQNTPSSSQLKTIALVFIASFLASLLNPNFIGQYSYAPHFVSSSWHTRHIIEMFPLENNWLEMTGVAAVVLISFLLNRKRFSLIHFLLVAPFIILASSALRFVFIVAIIGFPILARNISASLASKGWKPTRVLTVAATAFIVLFCISMVSEAVRDKKIGFSLDIGQMPKGAIEYMDGRDINGRILNPYTFGQYIIWTSYPKRTVFVDARGYLPPDLLDKMLKFKYSRATLDELYEEYGFESVLTGYSNYAEPYALSSDPRWALVYWDDASLLYLRRGGEYDKIIKSDEYRFVHPELTPLSFIESPPDKEQWRNLIAELTRNVNDVDDAASSRAHTLLGFAYYANGEVDLALEHLLSAVKIAPKNTSANYGLGLLHMERGDYKKAKMYFEKCLRFERFKKHSEEARNRLKELRGEHH